MGWRPNSRGNILALRRYICTQTDTDPFLIYRKEEGNSRWFNRGYPKEKPGKYHHW